MDYFVLLFILFVFKKLSKPSLTFCRTFFASQQRWDLVQPLNVLTENEQMMKDTGKYLKDPKIAHFTICSFPVAKLAQEQIGPYVREMENEGKVKDSVVKMLFENGVSRSQIINGWDVVAIRALHVDNRVYIIML